MRVNLVSEQPRGRCALLAQKLYEVTDLDEKESLRVAFNLFARQHPRAIQWLFQCV